MHLRGSLSHIRGMREVRIELCSEQKENEQIGHAIVSNS